MQFDCARGSDSYLWTRFANGDFRRDTWETHHERLVRRFAEVGWKVCGEPYAAPRIVYWNLRGDTAGFPVQADAPNTQMLSGFSPALLKLVLSGEDLVGDKKEVVMPDGTTPRWCGKARRLLRRGRHLTMQPSTRCASRSPG